MAGGGCWPEAARTRGKRQRECACEKYEPIAARTRSKRQREQEVAPQAGELLDGEEVQEDIQYRNSWKGRSRNGSSRSRCRVMRLHAGCASEPNVCYRRCCTHMTDGCQLHGLQRHPTAGKVHPLRMTPTGIPGYQLKLMIARSIPRIECSLGCTPTADWNRLEVFTELFAASSRCTVQHSHAVTENTR
jgi:hypothetical protein